MDRRWNDEVGFEFEVSLFDFSNPLRPRAGEREDDVDVSSSTLIVIVVVVVSLTKILAKGIRSYATDARGGGNLFLRTMQGSELPRL